MRKRTWRTVLVSLNLALAACVSTGEHASLEQRLSDRGYRQGEAVRDIQNYRLNGWNHLDSKHIIIDTGPSRRYLVSLRVPCHELSAVETIGFTNTAGQLTKFDSIRLKDSAGIRRECPIDAIYTLEKTE
ncbi:MAG TPA: DUF6491 family protein [Spongiibacteraceae bacterium]|jgi:hypothetical protein|nr:DUF6491 family protein [Spongiibacteraceae bacterium]HUH37575.1 DUF6491 family protein [Spongiibacteraceae bacterium]